MTVAELEQAITQLSEQELDRFHAWFDEYYAELWDKQIEEDEKAGKLDKLIAESNRTRVARSGLSLEPMHIGRSQFQ